MSNFEKLKKSIKSDEIENLYVFTGVEDFLKNHYLSVIENKLLDENFKSFNLEKFDENNFEINEFYNSVESFPAMSEKKLIIVRDIDVFKQKADIREKLVDIFSDIPEYTHIIFDYATIEYKPDNRQKIGKLLKDSVVSFEHLSNKDLYAWIVKKLETYNLKINAKTLDYLIFICSKSMTNLKSEIDKLGVYSKEEVTTKDIDDICTKVLEAKIFDITDKLLKGNIDEVFALIDDLIMLNTDEFAIISVINSQFQRLYSAKIGIKQRLNEKAFMDLWGIYSGYAVKITLNQAKVLEHEFLKKACNLSVNSSMDLVSKNMDKREIINDLIINIGALL